MNNPPRDIKFHLKALVFVLPVVLLIASLFYASDVNFKLQYFNWLDYAYMILQVISPVLLLLLTNLYMANKSKNDNITDNKI
jgi:hypothetical protein